MADAENILSAFKDELEEHLEGKEMKAKQKAMMLSIQENTDKTSSIKTVQLLRSNKAIEKVGNDSSQLVSNVKLAVIEDEIELGKQIEDRRKIRIEKLERENIIGTAHYKEISGNWGEIVTMKSPTDMHQKLLEQKAACDAVISEKNQLIKELMQEIMHNENEYERLNERQAEEIEISIDRCRKQVDLMKRCYSQEININKKSQNQRWQEQLHKNKNELDESLQSFDAKELEKSSSLRQLFDTWEKELDGLGQQTYIDYSKSRNQSDKVIEVLHLQLQETKSALQLNREKLEYTYQLLKKREDEQLAIKSKQRRQITKLYNAVAKLKVEVAKREKLNRERIKAVHHEYERMTEQVETNERKFKQYQTVEEKKFKDIWQMNEEKAKKFVKRLYEINDEIDMAILGQPTEVLAIPFYEKDEEIEEELNSKILKSTTLFRVGLVTAKHGYHKRRMKQKYDFHRISTSKITRILLENFVEVASEFLDVQIESLATILNPLQKLLLKLDAILTALNIQDNEEIEILLQNLYSSCVKPQIYKTCHEDYVINKEIIMKTVQEFLKNRENDLWIKKYYQKAIKTRTHPQLKAKEIEEYWNQYLNLLPSSKLPIWENICLGLQKLRLVKVETRVYEKENQKLRQQNDELRCLLTPFMQTHRAPA